MASSDNGYAYAHDQRSSITWEDFGPFLCRLRRRRGLSQERLAALLGCHRLTVWRIEHGERPSRLVLRAIGRVDALTAHEARVLAAFVALREAHTDECA
jgi:transcriptional regulator with XRE-family HTH domain